MEIISSHSGVECLSGNDTPLSILVGHRHSVLSSSSIGELYEDLKTHDFEFVAVVSDEQYIGTVSRQAILGLTSGRYGFNLHSRRSVTEYLCRDAIVVANTESVEDVIHQALSDRDRSCFHHDVALVDDRDRYLGMIPSYSLVQRQREIMDHDTERIECQRLALESKNRKLFESLEDLKNSRGQFHSLFSENPLAIVMITTEGIVEEFNPEFQKLFPVFAIGAERKNLPRIHELLADGQEDEFSECIESISPDMEDRPEKACEFKFIASAPTRTLLIRLVFATIPETGQTALLMEDITEQRKLKERIEREEKSQLLDTLVGGIAHELNNKLSPIMGFLSLSEEGSESPFDLNSVASIIRESTSDATRIIRQLLDLSRPPTLERTEADLGQLILHSTELLSFESRKTDCTLIHEDPDQEPVIAVFDAGQIRQVIINLVVNGIHAVENAPQKEVRISVTKTDDYAEIKVADTGCGISPEKQERIFEPFYTTRPEQDGTGLGLSVCENIVRLHDGELTCESTEGEGSTFTLRIPVSSPDAQNGQEENQQDLTVSIQGKSKTDLSKMKCLVVDDEPYIATFLTKALKAEHGIESVTAVNGKNAIDLLRCESFDLVISDVRMPGIDGFELLEWISKYAPSHTGRFLFMTGDAGGSVFEEKLRSLSPPVLRKPFQIDELSSACSGIIAANIQEPACA